MKKCFIVLLMFFIFPSFGIIVSDYTGQCGNDGFDKLYAVFEPNQYTCQSGYYLPQHATSCAPCPAGYACAGGTYYFNETESQGLVKNTDYYASVLKNTCGDVRYNRMYAVFEPLSYMCSAGYFLPAATSGCRPCPTGYICSGGTYVYNDTQSQGLVKNTTYVTTNEANACAVNFEHRFRAVYEPISYTCGAGYFLPAATPGCAPCPMGYTCNGGTFAFNEQQHQGLVKSENNPYVSSNVTNGCATNFVHAQNAAFELNAINLNWQDENGNQITSNTCAYGDTISLPEPPRKQGYRFVGWNVVNNQ